MAQGYEVLEMLIPTGGWVIYADDFDSIIYDPGVKPISKKEYTDGFAKVDAFKIKQDETNAAQRQAILDKLGLTADEARLLLG